MRPGNLRRRTRRKAGGVSGGIRPGKTKLLLFKKYPNTDLLVHSQKTQNNDEYLQRFNLK
jgi:hypothetical protein